MMKHTKLARYGTVRVCNVPSMLMRMNGLAEDQSRGNFDFMLSVFSTLIVTRHSIVCFVVG